MSNLTVTFQDYTMNQLYLPMDFSYLIPEDHVARMVSEMIDALDDQLFFDAYKGGGRPAYHPKMMAKIVLYGYDARLLLPHWKSLKETGRKLPKHLVADAGYGSEPNDIYLSEQADLHTLIPYNTYKQEQKRSFSKKMHHPHNWTYEEKDDLY